MQLMKESMRWFGPDDPVSLRDIRQCGCSGVITALHHIPYGELWTPCEIATRKAALADCGLEWTAAESVPVSEDIKTRTGDFERHIENYKETIRNLGAVGVDVVIYNFMPVLDWVRTDLSFKLDDGTDCLRFDPVHFAAFEIYLLKRPDAEKEYTPEQLRKADLFFKSLTPEESAAFERSIIDVFPGVRWDLNLQDVRDMLARYNKIDRDGLKRHLKLFLQEIIPVCEEVGVRMAIHPDDPPFSVMGLPRIVCCEEDVVDIYGMADSLANGLCFCAGSFSARAENDLPQMVKRLGHRIHALHLRSTKRNDDGSFYEADHLGGSVDMCALVQAVLLEISKRKAAGRADWQLSFRPDHGHVMLDDQGKRVSLTPGYPCIGRLRGLSEIRGLQLGIASCFPDCSV